MRISTKLFAWIALSGLLLVGLTLSAPLAHAGKVESDIQTNDRHVASSDDDTTKQDTQAVEQKNDKPPSNISPDDTAAQRPFHHNGVLER